MAARAARCFLDQDHPRRELVIVADGDTTALRAALPRDHRIRVVPTDAVGIGTKRNIACSLACGDVIVHWDDDDWHGPQRLSRQVAPLVAGAAELTGLRGILFLDVDTGRFWRCSQGLHRQIFRRDVAGGTLAFHRAVWNGGVRYPDTSLAEDADFLDAALRRRYRLAPVAAGEHFVYVRHGDNTWRFRCGRFVDMHGWIEVPGPRWPAATRLAYGSSRCATADLPLVSCIMPTRGRRGFVPRAVAYFQRQRYPRRELVVLDDGPEPVADLLPDDPAIRYVRLPEPMVLGAKRNLACELAGGEVVAHWDDDDWYPPDRLDVQIGELLARDADVCGASALYFLDPAARAAWRFRYGGRGFSWLAGASLCYRREVWAAHPFEPRATGEDNHFLLAAAGRPVVDVAAADCVVALVHPGNTSAGRRRDAQWAPAPVAEVERLLGDDAAAYRDLKDPRREAVATGAFTAGPPARTGRRR